MEVCADDTNLTLQNRLSLPQGPTINGRGNYTFRQIEAFSAALEQNVLDEAESNPIAVATRRYGDTFGEGQQQLNTLLNRTGGSGYPDLNNRLQQGPITALEYAGFITDYNLTPADCTDKCFNDVPVLLSQLNSYYQGSFAQSSMGGLCAQMPNFFAQIEGFFTLLGTAEAIIKDALEFLTKIRDLDDIIKAAIQKITVKALIEKLKEQLIKGLMDAFDNIRSAIENFNIENVIGNVSTFINEQLVKRVMTQKEKMCLFFNDENKKAIEDKFKSLVDYAVGLFENPNIEELYYLISRFCAFIFNIEALMNQIKSPLDNFANKYSNIANRLKIISNINTSSAIRNGAVRMSDEKKKELIEKQETMWSPENGKAITPTGEEPVNVKRITIKEYSTLPSCKDVKEGTDSKIGISGDWVDDENCGLEGYVNIDLDVKVYLIRLSDELGSKMDITSGWRSQQYNEEIGAPPESSHMSGKVVDIKAPGDDEETFTNTAIKVGFKHVRFLDSGDIHLDIRRRPS